MHFLAITLRDKQYGLVCYLQYHTVTKVRNPFCFLHTRAATRLHLVLGYAQAGVSFSLKTISE
jgi:hypothetical protein